MKILVVDDEEGVRGLLQRLLSDMAEVHLASNGQEGWEEIERWSPEVVVTDINMPVMGGIELAQKAGEIYPQVRFVFMTGLASNLEEFQKPGSKCVAKPFNILTMKRIVAEVLEEVKKEAA